MCNSQQNACCRGPHFFQENFCGNFNNPASATGPITITDIWSAPFNDYFEGTFQIANSALSLGNVITDINSSPGTITTSPGVTTSIAIIDPTTLTLTVPPGTNGTYCINLYKRVLA
ncbi:hypothetical protein IIU_07045 [Bacillus cereus VD133]|uniref:Endospore appendages core domain-containing protein n=1 Tax=Bacillus cereus VD133 TaxID=1053233 RepID=A0A9W5UYR2_BACCE|nr:S-Ena type endospore appendage [Bacillus cereus]EOO23387.1 hypothetical protein IIU_07045 [Bacillus cereus VD133]